MNRTRTTLRALVASGATLSLISLAAAKPPQPDLVPPASGPPLAPHTADSGGPVPAEQAALEIRRLELSIRVEPETRSIEGDAELLLDVTAPISTLLLDLDPEFAIKQVSVNGKTLPPASWSNPDGLLRITLPDPISQGGALRTRIIYGGAPHAAKRAPWDGGFVWAKTPAGQPWVGSAVQMEGCDLIWPCLDFPTKKPAFAALHITVPPGLSAPANGVLRGVRQSSDGWRTFDWEVKRPGTYSIAINVGPYEVLKSTYHSARYGNDVPMEFWYLPGHRQDAERLLAQVPQMVTFDEARIGPYPYGDEKIGMVETPYEGMEHQTINAYGAGYAITGAGYDELLQHELSHEWFGNQVTNKDWADMWLHEAFATYLHPLYSQYLKGDGDYYSLLRSFRFDTRNKMPIAPAGPLTSRAITQEGGGPGLDIYDKGALVLDTLRHLIGDRSFYKAWTILAYGRSDPKPGNFGQVYASTEDYISIVNRVTGRDLNWFFDAYLRNAALPELLQNRDGNRLELRWKTGDGGRFPLPVEVEVGGRLITVPMTDGTGSVAVAPDQLLTIDPHSKLLRRDIDTEALMNYKKAHPKGAPIPPAQQTSNVGSAKAS